MQTFYCELEIYLFNSNALLAMISGIRQTIVRDSGVLSLVLVCLLSATPASCFLRLRAGDGLDARRAGVQGVASGELVQPARGLPLQRRAGRHVRVPADPPPRALHSAGEGERRCLHRTIRCYFSTCPSCI